MLFRRRRPSQLPSVIKAEENMKRLYELRKVPVDPKVNEAGLERARQALRERQLAS